MDPGLINSQFIDLKERLPSSPMLTFFAITVMLSKRRGRWYTTT
jgi:hypothetical protein